MAPSPMTRSCPQVIPEKTFKFNNLVDLETRHAKEQHHLFKGAAIFATPVIDSAPPNAAKKMAMLPNH